MEVLFHEFSHAHPHLGFTKTRHRKAVEEPIVAVDAVGAGPGEIIYYITASEAVIPLPVDMAPIDASIVGFVDSIHTEK